MDLWARQPRATAKEPAQGVQWGFFFLFSLLTRAPRPGCSEGDAYLLRQLHYVCSLGCWAITDKNGAADHAKRASRAVSKKRGSGRATRLLHPASDLDLTRHTHAGRDRQMKIRDPSSCARRWWGPVGSGWRAGLVSNAGKLALDALQPVYWENVALQVGKLGRARAEATTLPQPRNRSPSSSRDWRSPQKDCGWRIDSAPPLDCHSCRRGLLPMGISQESPSPGAKPDGARSGVAQQRSSVAVLPCSATVEKPLDKRVAHETPQT